MSRYQVMPNLPDDEYQALKADIATAGVLVPVEYDEHGEILDGHHRVRACQELGIKDWPSVTRLFGTEQEKLAHARRINLARRQLTRQQRRQLIADEIGSDPDRSDREIGRTIGCDHKTVGSVRRELTGGEVPHPDEVDFCFDSAVRQRVAEIEQLRRDAADEVLSCPDIEKLVNWINHGHPGSARASLLESDLFEFIDWWQHALGRRFVELESGGAA